VVGRCLRRNPADRFQSGDDLAAALHGCFRKEIPVETASADSREISKKGTPAWVFAVVLAVLAAAGGGVYYFTIGRDAASPTAAPSVPTSIPKGAAASSLRLSTSPAGARVFLDGAPKGESPLLLSSSAGKHEVRLTLAGYEEWEAQVELAQGAEVPLDVELVRSAANTPPIAAPKAARERPVRAGKAEVPAAKAKPTPTPDPAVQKDLEEGIRSYEQGKIDVSIVKLEYVLRQDPENARAKQYLAMAQERKRKVMEQWGKQLDEAPVSGGKKR
jgi:hypothetical protein